MVTEEEHLKSNKPSKSYRKCLLVCCNEPSKSFSKYMKTNKKLDLSMDKDQLDNEICSRGLRAWAEWYLLTVKK